MVSHLTRNKRIARFIIEHSAVFTKMFRDRNPLYGSYTYRVPLSDIEIKPVDKYSRKRITGILFIINGEPIGVMAFDYACKLSGLDYNLYVEELES